LLVVLSFLSFSLLTIGGNMGKEEILNIIKEFNENGNSYLEVNKVDNQKVDLEAVLDKMCQ